MTDRTGEHPGPEQVPAPRGLVRDAAFSLLVLLVAFGVPEALVRAFWKPPLPRAVVGDRRFMEYLSEVSLGTETQARLYEADPERLWRLVPGVALASVVPHFNPDGGEVQPVRITINGDGFRGPSLKARRAPGTVRVLCLGDSNIFGYPLDDADVFPRVLERRLAPLASPSRVEVLNGGVPGYTVSQGALWYERQFRDFDYDWLILGYINNDAWPQPRADREVIAARRRLPAWVVRLAQSIRLVRWGQSLLERETPEADLVPRISLEEFTKGYRQLLDAAARRGARALILDFRAYESYAPYSLALQRLARERGVGYYPVLENARRALAEPERLRSYGAQYARVRRRWGGVIAQRPHLLMYAEYFPEHLNEVGTAWLADEIAPLLALP